MKEEERHIFLALKKVTFHFFLFSLLLPLQKKEREAAILILPPPLI